MERQIQSKEEYLKELENSLKSLPELERQNALKYYEEYFNDAGKENELSVINELGDVEKLASMIKETDTFKDDTKEEVSAKKENNTSSNRETLTILLLILLLVVSVPILLPIAISVIATLFGIGCAGVGIGVVGAACFGFGIAFLFTDIFGGIFLIGLSFILIAIGIALTIAIGFVGIKMFPSAIRQIVKLCQKVIGRSEE